MGILAVAWFFWVRTLASDRAMRILLVWALFVAAGVVAMVSLALGTRDGLPHLRGALHAGMDRVRPVPESQPYGGAAGHGGAGGRRMHGAGGAAAALAGIGGCRA